MSIRTEKVASVIKRAVTQPIEEIGREYSAGLVTITQVMISPDLQNAKIYFSLLGGKIRPLEFITILDENKYRVKEYLVRKTDLRYIPELRFFMDDTLDQMDNIQKLIDKAKLQSNPNS